MPLYTRRKVPDLDIFGVLNTCTLVTPTEHASRPFSSFCQSENWWMCGIYHAYSTDLEIVTNVPL